MLLLASSRWVFVTTVRRRRSLKLLVVVIEKVCEMKERVSGGRP